jgi:FHS family L-fucose permease-like MFS transporter
VVLVLAAIFFFSSVPDIKNEDRYWLEDSRGDASQGLWGHPHFVFAVVAQFLYVAAQAGIFSFFINYMTSQVPAIPESWNSTFSRVADHGGFLQSWLSGWFRREATGTLSISNKGAANLASVAFVFFLAGRFIGAQILRTVPGHRLLAIFGAANVVICLLVFAKLGWLSVACVFATYLFMSIMFPTIFALGIYGLGAATKRASAYLVMAIIGGALLPKLMGYVADQSDMSRAFMVPMVCFVFITYYGYRWTTFSREREATRL